MIKWMVVGLLGLCGCASLGEKNGFKDSRAFQSGKDLKPNYGIKYMEGWKKALSPDVLAEEKKKEDEAAAVELAKKETEKKAAEAEREKIKNLMCK